MIGSIDELKKSYKAKREEIKKRLVDFKEMINENDERLFAEMAFCICTPQSKATLAWKAIEAIVKNNYLFIGSENMIRPFLNSVRFCDNKAKFIVEARKKIKENGRWVLKEKISSFKDSFEAREWLVENIKGFGMKEASHFLRNIGLGGNLAILDVHILDNLKTLGVIDEIPKGISDKNYLEIESKLRDFSRLVSIPMDELDLVFWSEETGIIFK
jgi:N-glycosylase/DNA lyase